MTTAEKAEKLMFAITYKTDKEGRKPNKLEADIYEIAQAYLQLLKKEL